MGHDTCDCSECRSDRRLQTALAVAMLALAAGILALEALL